MQAPTKIPVREPETDFDRQLEIELARYAQAISKLLNNGLKFADNFNMQIKSVTTDGVVGTETAVAHTLGRVPSDFLVGSQDKAGTVYKGSTAWTATTIYVRGSVASITANLYIF